MDHGYRKEERSSNQEAPKLLVEAGVQMLTPTCERTQAQHQANEICHFPAPVRAIKPQRSVVGKR